ncbi:MAG TPA: hypothetical protein VJM81_09650 [Rhizorhapis sp.]|nr:hypothetical protein [Rhizorhapis sp.]
MHGKLDLLPLCTETLDARSPVQNQPAMGARLPLMRNMRAMGKMLFRKGSVQKACDRFRAGKDRRNDCQSIVCPHSPLSGSVQPWPEAMLALTVTPINQLLVWHQMDMAKVEYSCRVDAAGYISGSIRK